MSETCLAVRNLVKRFGRVTAVDDVSFRLERGEVLTLLGPSGCGKTTTLRMVAGFEKPDAGEIEIQGQLVVSSHRRLHVPPEKRGLGMVFQSYAIWPHMTVFENVAYPLTARKLGRQEVRRRVEETLALVGLDGFAGRSAMLLSGGQQQRVALARALVYDPEILLLDEPLSNLDAKLRGQMRLELKRLQERVSATVLFVTHDQLEAMSLSTRLAVMSQGRIAQMGTPREVYEQPATPFVEDFLGRVLRLRGSVLDHGVHGTLVEIADAAGARLRVEELDETLAAGQRVLVGIRPEHVQVGPAAAGAGLNRLRCTVESRLYLGSEYELLLRLGDHAFSLVVSRAALGDDLRAVEVHLPAEHLRIWPEDHAWHGGPDDESDLASPLVGTSRAGVG